MAKTLTLEEAAQKLGVSPEQFKVNLKTHKDYRAIRPLMGGASMHFREQDIDELARRLGMGSDQDLALGDATAEEAPLKLDDDQIDIGRDLERGPGGSSLRLSSSKSGVRKAQPAKTDADAPLVLGGEEGSSGFALAPDEPAKAKGDSDVKLEKKGKPDSDVKLQKPTGKSGVVRTPTEEIDLDAEQSGARKSSGKSSSDEVFGIADDAPAPPAKKTSAKKPIANSDFELKLGADSSDEFELEMAGDDGSDEVDLGTAPKPKGGSRPGRDSGVNLKNPNDSGISLEKDSDSEFELNLDSDSARKISGPKSGKKTKPDSDSEFDLNLDDSGSDLSASDQVVEGEGGKDIFETDFNIPALDDESASEAVALEEGDTDLDSSDFDLAIDDSAVAEDSASEVIELEEGAEAVEVEDADEPSAAEALAGVDDDEEPRPAAAGVAAPAKWGALPALVLMPCVVVMFLVGLMGFELLRGMWGYHQPSKPASPITMAIAKLFVSESELPKD